MKRYYIDDLIDAIAACVASHNLGRPGEYARYAFGDGVDLGINEYGCADAANIRYTIGCFERDPDRRAAEIAVLQGLQDPETGLFCEATHHPIHTTAHCSAALELYDAAPLHPCHALAKYADKENLFHLLEHEIDWETQPWRDSHKGAGILPCLDNAGMIDLAWKDAYFDWMWEHSDPETGFFMCGTQKKTNPYQYMASGFHYMFNHEAEHRPLRYPERVIDTCLDLMRRGLDGTGEMRLCTSCDFIDVDVVYTLTRAMRQTPHRFAEAKQALEAYAERYLAMMYAIDPATDVAFNDLHRLFGAVCCIAELQSALPGRIMTKKPLRLVLDRRPFI